MRLKVLMARLNSCLATSRSQKVVRHSSLPDCLRYADLAIELFVLLSHTA